LTKFADLEISFHKREQGQYSVELRLSLPDSEARRVEASVSGARGRGLPGLRCAREAGEDGAHAIMPRMQVGFRFAHHPHFCGDVPDPRRGAPPIPSAPPSLSQMR